MNPAIENPIVARLENVSLYYGQTLVLDNITLEIPAGSMVGLIGPDGVGKSSLMALITGARKIQTGRVNVLDGDMADKKHRNRVCPAIAYMPQGLGKNLYPTLSVEDNLQFFGRLFGHNAAERRRRIDSLTHATGLFPFLQRPAGKLSGGMKQKLGLCCALIHDPDLLVLDEPTTGVDPLARNQFWELIDSIRAQHAGMSVVVATAYMDEAERFEWLVAMDEGRILTTGTPNELHERTGTDTLEAAFIALLPDEKKHGHHALAVPPYQDNEQTGGGAIEARNLTKRFGDFTAVNNVSFRIRRGEIFGFLGSNGCGKTTTMKMLTGLLPPTSGTALLFGEALDSNDIATRRRVGYMSQAFSLYSELSVRQNLVLHARLFSVPEADIPARVKHLLERFGLSAAADTLPDKLPLGMRQRLSLAVAMVHAPELLILDEPTSGVDPVARDSFWELLIDLARNDQVTIFISTHFMNEAERCDRISLMHAGQVLVSDTPAALIEKQQTGNLEAAFIAYLEEARSEPVSQTEAKPENTGIETDPEPPANHKASTRAAFSWARAFSYSLREALELRHDRVRMTMASLGSIILMLIMAYGITMDVDDLSYAVMDHDQSSLSQSYKLSLEGSPYFVEQPPLQDYDDLDKRMRSGELALAIEIPPGFGRDLEHGRTVQIGAWVDGAMPQRAETVRGYVQGLHQNWLMGITRTLYGKEISSAAEVATRYRYNPDVKSLPAMAPAVIPLLLLMIPAMLSALAVVREKEMGSIINLYVTPVTRLEFLLGKQLPYLLLGMMNFLLLSLLVVTVFDVPVKGSFLTLTLASMAYVWFSTGFGLLASTFTQSQIAALFFTMIGSMLPAVQFSGMTNPVSSLEGSGRLIGEIYPTTYYMIISRGVFNKALGMADLLHYFIPIILGALVMLVLSVILLKKQER